MAKILIADDDELMVDFLRELLGAEGHIVGAVDDGAQVLQIVRLKRPDLVILDCRMPSVAGVQALREIRLSPDCYDTPVLMLTACISKSDEEIALRAGANDYLRKPIDPDRLIVRVESLLEHSACHHQPPLQPRPVFRL